MLDDDLRLALLGRAGRTVAATLPGYRRLRVRGATYPMIVPWPGGRVRGAVLDGVTPEEAAILDAYEGTDYKAVPKRVSVAMSGSIIAWTFVPTARIEASDEGWTLERWQRTAKPSTLRRIRCGLPW